MKAVVTGGAGFIGSHIVDDLLAQGHEVVVIDNLLSGGSANLNPQARFYKVDLRSDRLKEILALERPELISHHAAYLDYRPFSSNARQAFDINVCASLNLLEWASQYQVKKVIYASSALIYGQAATTPLSEETPPQPLSHYAVHKSMVEQYLLFYQRTQQLDFTILRYPLVFGSRQLACGPYGLIADLIERVLANRPVFIAGNGGIQVDLLHIDDVITANRQAILHGNGQIINLGSGQQVTIDVVFDTLSRLTSDQQAPNYIPDEPISWPSVWLAIEKAARHLAWTPQNSLEAGLRQTLTDTITPQDPASDTTGR